MTAPGAGPFDEFLDLRRSVTARRIGDGGRRVCHALSDALDAGLRAAARDLEPAGRIAVVAVGGYGRREQAPHSDVDVVLLHDDGTDPERAVKLVLYPLWDSGLAVGHAVRTVKESALGARADFTILTALLDARAVAGDGSLVDDLYGALTGVVSGRPLAPQLAALERDRRALDAYPLMAADLKEGRGGLRTFQGFGWERRRAGLLGVRAAPPEPEEARGRADLLAVRNALHAVAGKRHDVFHPDLRGAAAAWLGTDVRDVAGRMCRALRTGDRLAVARWPDVMVEPPGGSIARRLTRRFRRGGPSPGVTPGRPLAVAARAATRPEGPRLDSVERKAVSSGQAGWTEEDRAALLTILQAGESGRAMLDLLDEHGWLNRVLPEVAHGIARPQLEPFHDHPVDAHQVRTVDEMLSLLDRPDEPWLERVAAGVADRTPLVLAAWLHDIGKGRGGDHAEVGADLAGGLLTRAGFAPSVVAVVEHLVRNHLLLGDAAVRRDLTDPAVVADVVGRVQTVDRLRMLCLLTVADVRAAGTGGWTPWRSALHRSLLVRLERILEIGDVDGSPGRISAIAGVAGLDPAQVGDLASLLPPGHLASHTDEELADQVTAAASLRSGGAVAVVGRDDGTLRRLVVAARDRPGLLEAIAGVLVLHGLDVVDARLTTTASGIALDTFRVRSLFDREAPTGEGWARMGGDIEDALTGSLDLEAALREKARAYRRTGSVGGSAVRVRSDPAASLTALEVTCPDHPGALFEIVRALHRAGLDISGARIDTVAAEARDVFFVRAVDGSDLRGVALLADTVDRVRRELGRR